MRVLEGRKNKTLVVINMRTLCDACESAAAVLFCAADEASLCRACDDKIHMCNKLVSRHVRVELADPIDVPRCDICENSPAFFYCEIDGSSLCLQCDMAAHVGGKRNHGRYLLFRQRVEFPVDNVGHAKDLTLRLLGEDKNKMRQNHSPKPTSVENQKKHRISPDPISNTSGHEHAKRVTNTFDLNMKPHKIHGEASNYQEP